MADKKDDFQIGDFVIPTDLRAFQGIVRELKYLAMDGGSFVDMRSMEKHLSGFPDDAKKSPFRPKMVIRITDSCVVVENVHIAGFTPTANSFAVFPKEYIALHHRPKFKIGDRVQLVKTPRIDEDHRSGWSGSKGYLIKGAKATVSIVESRKSYGLIMDDEHWTDRDGVKHPVDNANKHVYYFHEDFLAPYKEPVISFVPTKKETSEMEFGYSFYAMKKGLKRPGVMLFQLAANQLGSALGVEEFNAGMVDGIAGDGFDAVAKAVQTHYDLAVDGMVGFNTWRKMTADLGDWRPPLRLRIAEVQNSYENGSRKGFDAWNIIKAEGWPNYGIWNVNYPASWGGSMRGSSLGQILRMANRTDLYQYEPNDPPKIAYFFGTEAGRNVQLYAYMNEHVISPAIRNLRNVGFEEAFSFEAADLPDRLDLFHERLLTLACDIAVNSGPYGFLPKRVPRIWDADSGTMKWDADVLPDRDACMKIFEEEFEVDIPSPTQVFSYKVDSRSNYQRALKRCLIDVCEDNEQRINLIADLQGRCIMDRWRQTITQRRRSISRLDGHRFQGADFNLRKNFGIGV